LSFVVVCVTGCSASDSGSGTKPGVSVVAPPNGVAGSGAAVSNPAAPNLTGTPMNTGAAGTSNRPPGTPGTAGTGAPPTGQPQPGTGVAGAGAAGAGAAGGMAQVPLTPHDTKTCLQPGNGNYGEPGPYKVGMMEVDLGMIEASQHTGKFTIYYPSPLEASCLHPIVAWGNGTGVQGSGTYAFFTSNAASWGMVVAESQEDSTGSGNFHKAGIDYLLKQNTDPSSMFYNKLSARAGVSGHSQGGFGASVGASHPNVETAAIEGATMVASAKVSVLVLTGTADIVSGAECLVTGAGGPMFVAVWEGGDHVTTETLAGYITADKGSLQFQRLYAAWFRCFLADDDVACKMFSGGTPSGCGICKDPGWHVLASAKM
jgi:hypothetical protein